MNDIMNKILLTLPAEKIYNLAFRDAYNTHLEELAEIVGMLETDIENGTFNDHYKTSLEGQYGEVKVSWELPEFEHWSYEARIEYTFSGDCTNVQAYYCSDPMDFILDHSLGKLTDLPFLYT